MKTSVIEIRDMLSVLSVEEVEQRIGEVPGVGSVTVDHAGGTATVRYDETRLDAGDIKRTVRQRGFETAETAAPSTGAGQEGHARPPAPAPAAPAGSSPPASPPVSTASDETPEPTSPSK